jgi:hypothetical protein
MPKEHEGTAIASNLPEEGSAATKKKAYRSDL